MFKPEEYRQRMQRLQQRVTESELDTLIVSADHNIHYLTGAPSDSGDRRILLVVPSGGTPALIVPRLEEDKMSVAIAVDNTLVYWEKDAKLGRGWEDRLQEVLGTAKTVGLDPHAYVEVLAQLTDREVQVSELVEDLRVIKSDAEITLTRRAAHYWTKTMGAMLSIAKAGLPISDLLAVGSNNLAEVFAKEPHASSSNTYDRLFFQCSPDSVKPHHVSQPLDVLPNGPSIMNAVGVLCGYNVENERTILTGDYSPEHAELFDIVHQAHQLALSLVKPGVPCADVDMAVQDFFTEQGLAEHMRHRIGHGLGLVYHERPYSSEGSQEIYQPGMVISVEPGLYINGVGGYRHSDTVLITEQGIENMTAATPIDRASLTF